jgi:MFS family permease
MSTPYLVAAFISPILGKLVDYFGYRAVVTAAAPVLLLAVHTFLGLTRFNPWLVLMLQGLAYASFAAVVWPSIPLVVESKYTGRILSMFSFFALLFYFFVYVLLNDLVFIFVFIVVSVLFMLCHVMLCHVMLCYVMLCYVMLCYVYAMLCFVILNVRIYYCCI